MADWTDGPEYAPRVRPDLFVAPGARPLDEATTAGDHAPPASPDTAWTAPGPAPTYEEPTTAVPLDRVAPPPGPERDPQEPFSVVSLVTGATPHTPTPELSSGQWGDVHTPATQPAAPAWAPTDPIPSPGLPGAPGPGPTGGWPPPTASAPTTPVPGASAPGVPAQAGPTQGVPAQWGPPQPEPGPRPVDIAEIVRAVTPGVLIALAVGGLVAALSLPLLWVAQALATRIPFRRTFVSRAFTVATLATLTLGLFTAYSRLGGFDIFTWFSASLEWGRIACWACLVLVVVVVTMSLRRGDRPESP